MSSQAIDFTEIIAPVVQYELFNPGTRRVEQDFDGQTYVFPAVHEHAVLDDPRTGSLMQYPKPGVLPIFDKHRPLHPPVPAREVVKFMVGPDGRTGKVGQHGIRPLFGDHRDAMVEEEAKRQWVENRRRNLEDKVRAWELEVAKAREHGDPVGRPPRAVMEAYSELSEMSAVSFERFSCPVCNWGFMEEKDMHIHTVAHHGDRPEADPSKAFLKVSEGLSKEVEVGRGKGVNAGKPVPEGIRNAAKHLADAERG